MRIEAFSDEENKALWNHYKLNPITNTDLLISCGDLNPHYLGLLVTFSNLPLLYVHGNHDERYAETPPEGCICIDDTIYVHEGVRILGLGGCYKYNNESRHMYTEKQMQRRIRRVERQIKKHKGFDILVTHAPAYGLGDEEDLPHRGFEAFLPLLEKYKPKYMIHGHVHMTYDYKLQRVIEHNGTKIINAYERFGFDYED